LWPCSGVHNYLDTYVRQSHGVGSWASCDRSVNR
jgi:hypothetical protein